MGPLFSGTVLLLTVLYAWLLESRRRVFFSDSPVELTSRGGCHASDEL